MLANLISERDLAPSASPLQSSVFDSFFFVDRLTNKRLNISNPQRNSHHAGDIHDNKTVADQVQVFRKTKAFEIRSLREKIFDKIKLDPKGHGGSAQVHELNKCKKKLKRIIIDSVENINIKEFKKVIHNSEAKIDRRILKMNSSVQDVQKTFCISGLKEILTIEENNAQEKPLWASGQKQQCMGEATDFQIFLEGSQFEDKMETHLESVFRNNREYLIPKAAGNQVRIRHVKKVNDNQSCAKEDIDAKSLQSVMKVQDFAFNSFRQSGLLRELRQRNTSNDISGNINNRIIALARNDNLAEINLQLVVDPSKATCRDQELNNLLHIAAKRTNIELAELVLKRVSPSLGLFMLDQYNKNHRTPTKIAQIFGFRSMIKLFDKFREDNEGSSKGTRP